MTTDKKKNLMRKLLNNEERWDSLNLQFSERMEFQKWIEGLMKLDPDNSEMVDSNNGADWEEVKKEIHVAIEERRHRKKVLNKTVAGNSINLDLVNLSGEIGGFVKALEIIDRHIGGKDK